jgi:hypothetical protein
MSEVISPPARRGSRADLRMQRYLKVIGAAWGGNTNIASWQARCLTTPGCADDYEIALHS